MSALFKRISAVVALIAIADHSDKAGHLVKLDGGKAAINDSATAEAYGVLLDGEEEGGSDSVAILGGNIGTVKFKAGGAITQGARLAQKNDGTVIVDPAAGDRVIVGKALEAAAEGELFEGIGVFPIVIDVA